VIVSRRTAAEEDQPFLQRLLLERTAQELPLDHLPAPIRDEVLRLQAGLRLQSTKNYANGSSEIIVAGAEPAGWILWAATGEELRLVEVAVLAAYRGRGIGTAAINQLIAVANLAGKPVRLRVNVTNAGAVRLYERLGFRRIGGDEVQHEMERPAAPRARGS
jgi:ribosomal protein S18 acetylase RimI-like enzyme